MSDHRTTPPGRSTPFAETLDRRRVNAQANWPRRGPDCRLEPECWPVLRPSFTIPRDARVFTIGSCFARNIELHLNEMGFHVPALVLLRERAPDALFLVNGLLNIYTPTAMRQELAWARAIFDRDDTLRESDVLPLLKEIAPGSLLDVHMHPAAATTTSLAEQMERRRFFYSIHREAFLCDVAVVTLGYVEAWWDEATETSIEFHPRLARLRDPPGVVFRKLRYNEVYEAVAQVVALIRGDRATKMMLTTSPVPFGSTFSSEDVIVANSHSKSVLRAVAGDIAEDFDGVDYVPTYEAVMLTKSQAVWRDDLVHVTPSFIGKVMAYVMNAYAPDADLTEFRAVREFRHAVSDRDWASADAHYEKAAAIFEKGDLGLLALFDLALYEAERRRPEAASAHIDALFAEIAREPPPPAFYIDAAALAQRIGRMDAAARLLDMAAELFAQSAAHLSNLISLARIRGPSAEVDRVLAGAEARLAGEPECLDQIALAYRARGNTAGYRRAKAAALAHGADAQAVWSLSVECESAGEETEGLALLSAFCRRVYDPLTLRRCVLMMNRARRIDEARSLLVTQLDSRPEDALALGLLALTEVAAGRPVEALASARRAQAAGSDVGGLANIVARGAQAAVLAVEAR